MILGIPYDYWHFVIPAVVLLVAVPVIFKQANKLQGLLWLALIISVLAGLQFWNEFSQMADPSVYGGWQAFVHNSKVDTKYFVFGSFAGLFGGFLVYSLIERIEKWKHSNKRG